jgi:hypothetical protein
VVNPPSATITSTFIFQTQSSSGTVLDQQTTSITLTATAGNLAAVTLSTSSSQVGVSNTLTVSFTIANKISAGGKVSITIPKWNANATVSTEIISMLQSSYSINVISNLNSAALSASFTSDVLTLSGGIPSEISANSVISFNVTNFLNPITTATFSGFTVTTLDSSNGSIDTASATLKVATSADVYGTSITSKDTTIVQELAELRIQFYVPVPLNSGCIIDVTFPSDFVLSGADLTNVQGFGLFGGSRALTGSVNVGNNTYTITDGCSTYVSQDQLAIMDFSSVENPFTVKTTGSIAIYIKDVNQYAIAQITSGITYASTVGTISNLTLTPEVTTVATLTAITISFLPEHSLTASDVAITITLPSDVAITDQSSAST